MALPAKALSALVDKYYAAKEKLTKANAIVKPAKELKSSLWNELKDALIEAKTDGAVGKKAQVKIVHKSEYKVDDHEKFLKYVLKNKAWDLLPKSIPQEAVALRFEDNKKGVPGVVVEKYTDLSITKV